MKIYKIKAPDGKTYRIEGPDGATENELYQVLYEQHPEALVPEQPIGMGFESVALLITSAIVGFGIAFFIERKITKILKTKGQKVWLRVAATIFGLGLMGLLNELIVIPHAGLKIHLDKVFSYIFIYILIFPSLVGLVIWWLNVKATDVDTNKFNESPESTSIAKSDNTTQNIQPSEDLFAQALNEIEGGERISGLWAKCFADADGLENVAKANYIKIRVTQLQLSIDKSIGQQQDLEKTNVKLDQASKNNLYPEKPYTNLFKYIVAGVSLTLLIIFVTFYASEYFLENKKKAKALEQIEEFEKQASAISKVQPVKNVKNYLQIDKEFITKIKGSEKVMVVQIAIMTYYDSQVFENIKKHEFALRSAILDLISQTTEAQYNSPDYRKKLSVKLRETINSRLEEYEGFGGIEDVMFTAFYLQ